MPAGLQKYKPPAHRSEAKGISGSPESHEPLPPRQMPHTPLLPAIKTSRKQGPPSSYQLFPP